MKKIAFILLSTFIITACNDKKNETKTTPDLSIDTVKSITSDPVTEVKTGYNIGDEATDFELQNIDNKFVSLSDYKEAKGFIVIFTCNHCPYAVAYQERILALDKKFASLGYPVIAINPNDPTVQPEDSFENMKIRAKEKAFTFPYLFDEGQKIYPQYGATKTPHVFILNKEENKNIVKYIGAIDDNYENEKDVSNRYVEDAINALLKNEEITVKTTASVGCSIKIKK